MPDIKQKRWVPICGVGIAVTATIAAAAMTGSCVFDTRTNFCEQFGIRCKEGQECAAHQPVCIDIGGCGNGVVDPNKGEMCDDGNIVDGEVVNGVFTPDNCSHDCMSDQTCGNKHIDVGETCDDGERNGLPEDGCDNNCHLKMEFCGNGIVDMSLGEQCDPGATDSAGCNSNQADKPEYLFNPDLKAGCKFSRCGDGYANTAINPVTMKPVEQCDSGGQITKACNGPLCTLPFCGDNFRNTEVGEDCDSGGDDTTGCNGNNHGVQGTGSCKFPSCGDGYANSMFKPIGSSLFEKCDTGSDSRSCNGNGNGGKANNPDGQCQIPKCGDGYVNKQFEPQGADDTENCDNKDGADTLECNGNNKGNDGPGSCRAPSCGDGYVNAKFKPIDSTRFEGCDTKSDSDTCNGNGNGDDSNNADAKCQTPKCGDGYVNKKFKPIGSTQFEECDTGVDAPNCNGNGNGDNANNLNAQCQMPKCGDGYVNTTFKPNGSKLAETCDNLNGADTSSCNGNNNGREGPGSCHSPSCGDGYVNNKFIPNSADRAEECDPGDPSHEVPAIICSTSGKQCVKCNCI